MTPLNSPLEIGLRLLIILDAVFPRSLDMAELNICDYRLLHSGEMGGPDSIHPPVPINPGELGIKRQLIETGLQVMLRADMVSIDATDRGVSYRANDKARGFIRVLESRYVEKLQEKVSWVVEELDNVSPGDNEGYVSRILHSWRDGRSLDDERGEGV